MIKKLILKYLGLTNFDEYLQKSEKRLTTIEMDMDNFEDRLKDLEDSEWTDYSVEDFVSSQDYNQAIDEMDTKIQELQDKEILDYESDDFVDYKEFEDTKNDIEVERSEMQLKMDRLTKALKKLAFQSNIELRIDEILEGRED